MTRDEAAKVLRDDVTMGDCRLGDDWATRKIDTFVRLGMLKLDEPKSAADKLSTLLWQFNLAGSEKAFRELLDANGLKIVEK